MTLSTKRKGNTVKKFDEAIKSAAANADHYAVVANVDPEVLKYFAAQVLASAYSDNCAEFEQALDYAAGKIAE